MLRTYTTVYTVRPPFYDKGYSTCTQCCSLTVVVVGSRCTQKVNKVSGSIYLPLPDKKHLKTLCVFLFI